MEPHVIEIFQLAFFFGGLALMEIGAEVHVFIETYIRKDLPEGKIPGDIGLR